MDINTNYSSQSTDVLRTVEELQSQNREPSSKLGQDAFLKLLVAQMSNQNPLEPSDDTEFIAQLAQFSMLEQMQSLNTTSTASAVQNYIGKYVYVEIKDSENSQAEAIYGKVDGVLKQDGIDYVLIGDQMYDASSVTGIISPDFEDQTQENKILDSANLLGKTIVATITDNEDEETKITGVVEKITINSDGNIYALVDGNEIEISNIEEISM